MSVPVMRPIMAFLCLHWVDPAFADATHQIADHRLLVEGGVFCGKGRGIGAPGWIVDQVGDHAAQVARRLFRIDQASRAHFLDAARDQELFEMSGQHQQGFAGQQKGGGGRQAGVGDCEIGFACHLFDVGRCAAEYFAASAGGMFGK
jgi:hypothetical protein